MNRILLILVIVMMFFLIKIDQDFVPENLVELQKIAVESTELEVTEEFTTDGCSIFPNSLWGKDLTSICIEHDMKYWVGGSKEERMDADLELKNQINGEIKYVGDLMYWGTRVGGYAMLPTPWRWGYGFALW
jgi:hypothetical protein